MLSGCKRPLNTTNGKAVVKMRLLIRTMMHRICGLMSAISITCTLYHIFQTHPATALQPFGLDPTSPTFWEDALEVHLGGLVEEAAPLATKLGYGKGASLEEFEVV